MRNKTGAHHSDDNLDPVSEGDARNPDSLALTLDGRSVIAVALHRIRCERSSDQDNGNDSDDRNRFAAWNSFIDLND